MLHNVIITWGLRLPKNPLIIWMSLQQRIKKTPQKPRQTNRTRNQYVNHWINHWSRILTSEEGENEKTARLVRVSVNYKEKSTIIQFIIYIPHYQPMAMGIMTLMKSNHIASRIAVAMDQLLVTESLHHRSERNKSWVEASSRFGVKGMATQYENESSCKRAAVIATLEHHMKLILQCLQAISHSAKLPYVYESWEASNCIKTYVKGKAVCSMW